MADRRRVRRGAPRITRYSLEGREVPIDSEDGLTRLVVRPLICDGSLSDPAVRRDLVRAREDLLKEAIAERVGPAWEILSRRGIQGLSDVPEEVWAAPQTPEWFAAHIIQTGEALLAACARRDPIGTALAMERLVQFSAVAHFKRDSEGEVVLARKRKTAGQGRAAQARRARWPGAEDRLRRVVVSARRILAIERKISQRALADKVAENIRCNPETVRRDLRKCWHELTS